MKLTRLLTLLLVSMPAFSSAETVVPAGFVLQVLEPLGGKIVRPKDWFYTEDHHGPSFTWIMSKEDAAKHRYDTGVRIQTLVGVHGGTGQTPKEFVLSFLEAKKKEAAKVLKNCPESDQGLFTRICLETEEGEDHILYSLFWGNREIDVVVVSIAGAKKADWPTYAATFDRMSQFELIDMSRFEKKTEANQELVPTATAVTPAADAPVAPAAAAAHL